MAYLSDENFNFIYGEVPRLTIDLYIHGDKGVVLSLRSIEPYLKHWHLPGGTVYKNETLSEAAVRIARKETGLEILPLGSIGHMEFPNEVRGGVNMHTVSIVIPATVIEGELKTDENAEQVRWFTSLPEPMVAEHKIFLEKLA
jgi:colanic acid biosynthesis protein WcaH